MKSIYLRNFRIFGDEGSLIKLSPITFLTGCNSAGKSSLAKAVLLLDAYLSSVRANDYNLIDTPLDFTKVVKLGNFDAVLNKESKAKGVEEIVLGYAWDATSFVGEMQAYFTFGKKDSDMLNLGWLKKLSICVDSKELLTIEILNGEYHFQITDIPTFIEYYRYFSVAHYAPILRKELSKNAEDIAWDQANNQAYNLSILPVTKEASELLDLETSLIRSGKLHPYIKEYAPVDTDNYDYFRIVKGAIGVGYIEKEIYDLEESIDRKLETADIDIIKAHYLSTNLNRAKSFTLKYHPEKEESLIRTLEKVWTRVEQDIISYIHSDATSIIEYVRDKNVAKIQSDIDFWNHRPACEAPTKSVFSNARKFLYFNAFFKRIFTKTLTPGYCSSVGYVDASTVVVDRLYSFEKTRFGSLVDRYCKLSVPSDYFGEYKPGKFIKKWLSEFGICDNILIDNQEGSARIRLVSKEVPEGRLLADYGYGVTQFVALLLHIEIAINKVTASEYFCGDDDVECYSTKPYLMILEEPEVHLHPRLQSKLADMFRDASRHNIQFIIETHSEYLIRRSQVLVAEMGLNSEDLEKQNPFKVYYFPQCKLPYDMGYRPDGRFSEEFGTGFFDEASNLAISLF